MLEVLDRDFNARIARWTEGDLSLSTPEVFFIDTDSHPAPGFASFILLESKEGLTIRAGQDGVGPIFRGGAEFPLSHLKRMGESHLSPGKSTLTLRSPPALIPKTLEMGEASIVRLDGAFELRRDAGGLVGSVVRLREAVGHSSLIYAPGIMEVRNLALLCYLGVDLFDSSLIILLSAMGKLLLPDCTIDAADGDWMVEEPTPGNVLDFNLRSVWDELRQVRWAISRRKLREMVETRISSDPWAVSALRLLDLEHYAHQERTTPVIGGRMSCNTKQSLHRPDVERWRRRILDRYGPPEHKRVLLLLPCSARKPYSTSRTHRTFRKVIDSVRRSHMVHEVIVTSPLGVVPREVELFYPASQYDIPVTGHWDCFERAMILELLQHMVSFRYDEIVCHLDDSFVIEGLECTRTSRDRPTSTESLMELRNELDRICGDLEPVSRAEDRLRTMESVARFQFGPGGEHLLDGAEIRGRYPRPKILENGGQLGMLSPERGMISLTIDGARKLSEKGINLVLIGDFDLKGNLFAVGVEEADPNIRKGDEAVVIRDGEVVGVGMASMSGSEMIELSRGEAVRIRHTA